MIQNRTYLYRWNYPCVFYYSSLVYHTQIPKWSDFGVVGDAMTSYLFHGVWSHYHLNEQQQQQQQSQVEKAIYDSIGIDPDVDGEFFTTLRTGSVRF